MSDLFQVHEAGACQTEHQLLFWTVNKVEKLSAKEAMKNQEITNNNEYEP